MMAGVDVDTFIGAIWKATEKDGFMELRLMLSTGQLVTIESVNDSVGPQVLAVRFDESIFPAGLEGRWVDYLTARKPLRKKTACPGSCLKRNGSCVPGSLQTGSLFIYCRSAPMLMKLQVELLGTESLLQMNDAYRETVAVTVSGTCENERVRLIASEMLSADDPIEKVAELAEQDPRALAVLLRSSLLVFSSMYEKQAMETELERR